MSIYSVILFFVLSLTGMHPVCAEAMVIHYPRASAMADSHADYVHELLRESLAFFHNKYRLLPSLAQMQQGRAVHEMKNGTGEVDLL